MIQDRYNKRKLTPKQKAAEILIDELSGAFYWNERNPPAYEAMTEREREKVNEFVDRLYDRFAGQLRKICRS